ncbi:MAG: hypothetical protein V1777_05705 [Candidatus Micrarchaeota archaeon]
MNSNGQIMSLDLIASVLVFLLVFSFLYQSYTMNLDRYRIQQRAREIQNRVQSHAELLVSSPGFPIDWNFQSVTVIGLAIEPNVLDPQKISILRAMTIADYNSVRNIMNLNAYEFRIDIDSNNNLLDTNFGKDTNGFSDVFASEKIVTIGGDYAAFRLSLFR